MDLAGTRQVVTFTQKYLVGVSLANGSLLWQRPYAVANDTSSQTPILYKDIVIATGRGNGVTAFKVVKRGDGFATENVWHTADVSAHMSDAVVIDGLLFGLSHLNSGRYFTLDLETGRVLWQSEPRQAEHAAIARAGQTIFSLEDDAELVVLRNNREKFEPVVRYEVATSATWSQPVVSQNRVLIRDVNTVALWTIN
jgi:outer membrane protein assembly factor BamB